MALAKHFYSHFILSLNASLGLGRIFSLLRAIWKESLLDQESKLIAAMYALRIEQLIPLSFILAVTLASG